MTKPVTFTQSDTVRLVQSAKKAGLTVSRLRVLPDGTIEADVAQGSEISKTGANDWDEVLTEQ